MPPCRSTRGIAPEFELKPRRQLGFTSRTEFEAPSLTPRARVYADEPGLDNHLAYAKFM